MIEQLEGGYYVRFNGQLSEVRNRTRSKAEEHLQKLQRGLVQFKPYKGGQQHNPTRTRLYQGYAGPHGRVVNPN